MRALAVAAALGLCLLAGTARAGSTWVIVPSTPTAELALPTAAPSLSGALPLAWTSPPLAPQQLSYGELTSLWQRAGAAYGIPWQVLAAINKIESNFGRNMGPSSAGAIGWMQFMPGTWLRWGMDANGDGVADPWNPDDAIFSAARYLAAAGGQTDIPAAVFSYNHADWYVNEVLQLANLFGDAGVDETFTLDRLQASLEQAQADVARTSQSLVSAQQDEARLTQRRDALLARADNARLLSAKLDLERRAVLADVAAANAKLRVQQMLQDLSAARADLGRARAQSRAASFAQGASTLLDAPLYDGGYVFPVGGGPSVVSVSYTHHDYPAADIAAPAGSPVYALADGVVARTWSEPDPRCGLGLTLTTDDGLTWTYCHLAYVDPAVQEGARLSAGALVGLVGSTGDASGPHLHLQTDPTTLWPQQLAWFEGFAGTAFRWEDGAAPAAGAVFAVVSDSEPVVGFTLNP